jgi:hypothetical protein
MKKAAGIFALRPTGLKINWFENLSIRPPRFFVEWTKILQVLSQNCGSGRGTAVVLRN